MMRFIKIGLFIVISGLFLTACGTPTVEPTSQPSADPTALPTATPPRAPRTVRIPTEYNLLYYPTDLNIVGNTGRPQFINAYADWCRECQYNRPFVHELQGEYGEDIDFLHVDIENIGAMDAVSPFGITGYSQYLLLNNEGDVIQRWYGVLIEDDVDSALADLVNAS